MYCQGDMSTHTLQAHLEYLLGVCISLQKFILVACEGEQGGEETQLRWIQQTLVYFGRASEGFAGFLYSVEKESSFQTQEDRVNLVQRAGQAIHTLFSVHNDAAEFPRCRLTRPVVRTAPRARLWAVVLWRMWGLFPDVVVRIIPMFSRGCKGQRDSRDIKIVSCEVLNILVKFGGETTWSWVFSGVNSTLYLWQ